MKEGNLGTLQLRVPYKSLTSTRTISDAETRLGDPRSAISLDAWGVGSGLRWSGASLVPDLASPLRVLPRARAVSHTIVDRYQTSEFTSDETNTTVSSAHPASRASLVLHLHHSLLHACGCIGRTSKWRNAKRPTRRDTLLYVHMIVARQWTGPRLGPARCHSDPTAAFFWSYPARPAPPAHAVSSLL